MAKAKKIKKILYLAFWNATFGTQHILRKIDVQSRHMRTTVPDSVCYVIGMDDGTCDLSVFEFSYFDVRKFPCDTSQKRRSFSFAVASAIVEKEQPDIIYFRYPRADEHTVAFLRRHSNVVFEHQTKELEELALLGAEEDLADEMRYGRSVQKGALGHVAVTHDFLEYQMDRGARGVPGYVMPNGIELSGIALRQIKRESKRICIMCCADFNYWHGYDRLLYGLKRYRDKKDIYIYFVGDGREKDSLVDLTRTLSLEKTVTFLGCLTGSGLDDIFNRCHIAIGSIGLHRLSFRQVSPLKHREYCARGIPFCFSGEDPDFPQGLPFVLQLPADDEPVDFAEIVSFANETDSQEIVSQMRQWASEHICWSIKIKKLCDFLSSLPRACQCAVRGAPKASIDELIAREIAEKKGIGPAFHVETDLRLGRMPSVYPLCALAFESTIGCVEWKESVFRRIMNDTTTDKQQRDSLCLMLVEKMCTSQNATLHEHYLAGAQLFRMGEYQKSAEVFNSLLEKTEDELFRARVFFYLGECAFALGRQEEAFTCFSETCLHMPHHQKATQRKKDVEKCLSLKK